MIIGNEGLWPLHCRFVMKNSNILRGGVLFSKLNDLIPAQERGFCN